MIRNQKKGETLTNLGVISDSTFHGSARIVVLNSESDVGDESPVVFGDRAFDFDLSERDHEALLDLRVQAEDSRRVAEVSVCCG